MRSSPWISGTSRGFLRGRILPHAQELRERERCRSSPSAGSFLLPECAKLRVVALNILRMLILHTNSENYTLNNNKNKRLQIIQSRIWHFVSLSFRRQPCCQVTWVDFVLLRFYTNNCAALLTPPAGQTRYNRHFLFQPLTFCGCWQKHKNDVVVYIISFILFPKY